MDASLCCRNPVTPTAHSGREALTAIKRLTFRIPADNIPPFNQFRTPQILVRLPASASYGN